MKWAFVIFLLLVACVQQETEKVGARVVIDLEESTKIVADNAEIVMEKQTIDESVEEVESNEIDTEEVEIPAEEDVIILETPPLPVRVSQVRYWLGTKTGTIQDLVSDGETKIYSLGGKKYEVEVLFIGEGDDGLGEAKFRINGKITKTLSKKETDLFDEKEFIFVREVFYR